MTVTIREGWLVGDLDGFVVQRRESPRPGGQPYLPLINPQAFIIHTTEGPSVDGAWSTLNSKGAAPHFIVGEGRIVQMRPMGAQGATVHDHNDIGWQVECVGFSKLFVHQLTLPTWRPLVALTRFFHEVKGVPMRRPDGWKDDCSDISTALATDNTRRRSRRALTFSGLLGHLDIPDQSPTWHWDPGCLSYAALIQEVGEDTDMSFEEFKAGWKAHRAGVTNNPDWPDDKNFGWFARNEAVENPKSQAHEHVGYAAKSHSHPADAHEHPDLAKSGHGHKTVGEAMPTG